MWRNIIRRLALVAMVCAAPLLAAQCVVVGPEPTAPTEFTTDLADIPPRPGLPTPTPVTGLILYESGGALYQLTVDAQGNPLAEPEHVAVDLAADERVVELYPSPDAQRVAFFSMRPPVPGDGEGILTLYLLTLQDGQVRRLMGYTGWLGLRFFGWHPDSQQIIYGDEDRVWLLDVQTDQSTRASADLAASAWAQYMQPENPSPNSRYAAWATDAGGTYRIHVTDLETGDEWELAVDPSRSTVSPAWSPDGEYLVFLDNWTYGQPGAEVWVAKRDGSEMRQLTFDGQPKDAGPVWLRAPKKCGCQPY